MTRTGGVILKLVFINHRLLRATVGSYSANYFVSRDIMSDIDDDDLAPTEYDNYNATSYNMSDPCLRLCEEFSASRRGAGFDLCDDPMASVCQYDALYRADLCRNIYWDITDDGMRGIAYDATIDGALTSDPVTCAEAEQIVFGSPLSSSPPQRGLSVIDTAIHILESLPSVAHSNLTHWVRRIESEYTTTPLMVQHEPPVTGERSLRLFLNIFDGIMAAGNGRRSLRPIPLSSSAFGQRTVPSSTLAPPLRLEHLINTEMTTMTPPVTMGGEEQLAAVIIDRSINISFPLVLNFTTTPYRLVALAHTEGNNSFSASVLDRSADNFWYRFDNMGRYPEIIVDNHVFDTVVAAFYLRI